jgi:hypothetical protein
MYQTQDTYGKANKVLEVLHIEKKGFKILMVVTMKTGQYWFLTWFIFYPEDGGDTFLWNICFSVSFTAGIFWS